MEVKLRKKNVCENFQTKNSISIKTLQRKYFFNEIYLLSISQLFNKIVHNEHIFAACWVVKANVAHQNFGLQCIGVILSITAPLGLLQRWRIFFTRDLFVVKVFPLM